MKMPDGFEFKAEGLLGFVAIFCGAVLVSCLTIIPWALGIAQMWNSVFGGG